MAKAWREERLDSSLIPLSSDFFPRIRGQLGRLKREAKGITHTMIVKRIKFMLEDLAFLRAQKILTIARLDPKSADSIHLTREERSISEPLSDLILRLQSRAERRDLSMSGLPTDDIHGNNRQSEEFKPRSKENQVAQVSHDGKTTISSMSSKELVLVRVVKPIDGKFVGIDGFQYGPFAIGDVVNLPYPNEEVLISKGVALEIGTDRY